MPAMRLLESAALDWAAWTGAHHPHSRLVANIEAQTVGWAALAPVSQRAVYRGVAVVSVYVATAAAGRGVRGQLMAELILSAEKSGIWMLQASIFEESEVSWRLHTRFGFRVVGRRERIGLMSHGPHAGEWRDTLLLGRRSAHIGR